MKLNRFIAVFLFLAMLLVNSCDVNTSVSIDDELAPLVAKQELFEKKLNQIVKKIDALQKTVIEINKSAPSKADNKPKQNKRKPADPNYVHNIPQGNSFFIGNPDAKVTITEFFDFQ